MLELMSALAFAFTGGCAMTVNEESGLIGIENDLPALQRSPVSRISGDPSARDLDRRHWTMQTVKVPLRQVEHNPAFMRSVRMQDTGRPGGIYPSTQTVVTEEDGSSGSAATEAAVELVVLPASWLRATIDTAADEGGLFRFDRSPRQSERFERLPGPEPDYAQRWIVRPTPTEGKVAGSARD